ncbi:MAG: PAS domain S-box protein [Chthoniobacteraceae bacterium]
MAEGILATSMLVQAWAVTLAVRLAVRQRRAGWVFVAVAITLMLGRKALLMSAALIGKQTPDPVSECIALTVSLLMAIGLTLLLRWQMRSADANASPEQLGIGALDRLKQHSVLLALVSLLGCAVLGYFAYTNSRDAVTNRLLKGSLDLAHMLEMAVASEFDEAAALERLAQLWRHSPSQYRDNYLCVIGADGKLLLNTRRPEKAGVFVGGTPVPSEDGSPRTVSDLIKARTDWAGRNRNSEGERQLAAYAYSLRLDALIAVHLPARTVDSEIRAAALPWGAGIALIFVVVLPLSFGLLHYVGASSQRAAFHAMGRQLESDRRYSLLVENVKDHAILLLDADGRVANWNPGAESLRGWTEAELKGREFSSFYTEADIARKQPALDLQAAAQSGSVDLEGWRVRSDGSRFWASVNITSIRDDARAQTGYLVVARDSTSRMQAEATLGQQQQVLRRVLDANENTIFVKDRESRILMANEATARFYGLSPQDLVGRRQDELHHELGFDPEDIRKWLADDRAVIDSGTMLETIETGLTREGRTLHYRTRKYPMEFSPGQPAVLVVSMDITSLVEANETLRASEERFRTIVESEPECVKIVAADGRLIEMNAAGLAMLECHSLEQVLERPLLEWIGEEYREGFAALHREVMQGGKGFYEFESIGLTGTRRWLETHAAPLRDAGGRVTALLGITRDITHRRKAEERIRQLNRVYVVLSDINQTIVREKDTQAMLSAACRIAVEKGQFRMAWIGLDDEPGRALRIAAHAGASDRTVRVLDTLIGEEQGESDCAFTMIALQTGQHGVCNDIEHDPQAAGWRDAAAKRGYRAMASLPLKFKETVIGTFNLYAGDAGFFDAEELRLLDELATDISFALEVAKREAERRQVDENARGQLDELLRWQDVMLAREDRVARLKAEINALMAERGQPPRYPSLIQP